MRPFPAFSFSALILFAGAASATPISGSDAIALFGVVGSPAGKSLDPIGGISSISWLFALTSSDGSGYFSPMTAGSPLTGSTSLTPTSDSGLHLTFGGLGTFLETGIVMSTNGNPGTGVSNVDLFLSGIFTPTVGSPTPSGIDLGFTETGVNKNFSYSGSGTLFSISPAPEPSSLMLLGTGLLGVAYAARRKFTS